MPEAIIHVFPEPVVAGTIVRFRAEPTGEGGTFKWTVTSPTNVQLLTSTDEEPVWDTTNQPAGPYKVSVTVSYGTGDPDDGEREIAVQPLGLSSGSSLNINLGRSASSPSLDQAFWVAIRNRTKAIGFDAYDRFIGKLVCDLEDVASPASSIGLPLLKAPRASISLDIDPKAVSRVLAHGVYGYELLRLATEAFLILQCGAVSRTTGGERKIIDPDLFDEDAERRRLGYVVTHADIEQRLRRYLGSDNQIPYLDRILRALLGEARSSGNALGCYQHLLEVRAHCPSLIELIWSYWHEEGMLAQTMNAIALRFQNKRRSERDPLARLEIDPLRPLNNLVWGYVQAEYKRLSVVRRAYEYDHHYGLTLQGKAVPALSTADSRSKFLETFHDLLAKAAAFYRADSDTTVIADAFPVMNGLKDCHLVLAEGAHSQFGDLPWTARAEMLIEQWLLARPEMREFLGGRAMVPYAEPWMGQVDTMKRLQGWGPTTVTHFRDLGVFGEQVLLSVRYGDWVDVNDEAQAKNWARYWKPEIQGYIHAYRAATGVDLASLPAGEADLARRRALPAALLAQRMAVPMPKLAAPARVPAPARN
jgi:hypothetical protein